MKERYMIQKSIYSSSLSEVFLATDSKTNQNVAIKVVQNNSANHRLIFYKEIEIAKKLMGLTHFSNLIDFFEEGNEFFLVTEYINGKSILETGIDLETKLDYFIQAAEALKESHEKGILHGDIKPENMLLDENGIFKFLDFGASIDKNSNSLSNIGTIPYMSPEQLGFIQYPTGNYTDLYSLGVCFYKVYSGQLPFQETDRNKLINKILTEKPVSLAEMNASFPLMISKIIEKLFEKDPSIRYQNAAGLIYDLKWHQQNPEQSFVLGEKDFSGELDFSVETVGFEKYQDKIERFFISEKNLVLTGWKSSGKTTFLNTIASKYSKYKLIQIQLEENKQGRSGSFFQKIFEKAHLFLSVDELKIFLSDKEPHGNLINYFLPENIKFPQKENQNQLSGKELENFLKKFFASCLSFFASKELFFLVDDFHFIDNLSLQVLMEENQYRMIASILPESEVEKKLNQNKFLRIQILPFTESEEFQFLEKIFSKRLKVQDLKKLADLFSSRGFYPGEVVENLNIMVIEKYLSYHPLNQSWSIDSNKFESLNLHNFYQTYLENMIKQLSVQELDFIKTLSLIPFAFDLETAALIYSKKVNHLLQNIFSLVAERIAELSTNGFLKKIGTNSYQLSDSVV